MTEVAGARVVITGASMGIGADTARAFADRGAHVILLARSQLALEGVSERIRAAGGRADWYAVDIGDLDAVEATSQRILAEHGAVDVLVNNAGSGRWLAIDETEPAEALSMTMVPYLGAFAITHHLVGPMIAQGSGAIMTITSPAAIAPFPGSAAYSIARAAMRELHRALRADLRGTGVHSGLVIASEVESRYWEHNPGSRDRVPRISGLIGTLSTEEVARAIVRAVEQDRVLTTIPWRLAAVRVAHHLAPGVVEDLVGRTGWRRPPITQQPAAGRGAPTEGP
jgi:short-subunit dehydrogenase